MISLIRLFPECSLSGTVLIQHETSRDWPRSSGVLPPVVRHEAGLGRGHGRHGNRRGQVTACSGNNNGHLLKQLQQQRGDCNVALSGRIPLTSSCHDAFVAGHVAKRVDCWRTHNRKPLLISETTSVGGARMCAAAPLRKRISPTFCGLDVKEELDAALSVSVA